MVLLALGDLEAAVELLGQDEPCHEMGERDVAEANSSVSTRTYFGRDSVASADDDLQGSSALLDIRYKIR